MGKYVLCCLGALALTLPARAGELDNEQAPARSAKAAPKTAAAAVVRFGAGSELDKEAPQQSCRCFHRCGCFRSCHRSCFRCGYACGYAPVVSCSPCFSCYQPAYVGIAYGGYSPW